MPPVTRRQVLAGAAGFAGALAIPSLAPTAAHAAAPAGFPTYQYLGQPLPANLAYNPTGELIFPCIRGDVRQDQRRPRPLLPLLRTA